LFGEVDVVLPWLVIVAKEVLWIGSVLQKQDNNVAAICLIGQLQGSLHSPLQGAGGIDPLAQQPLGRVKVLSKTRARLFKQAQALIGQYGKRTVFGNPGFSPSRSWRWIEIEGSSSAVNEMSQSS
jgi:hypothetical protein